MPTCPDCVSLLDSLPIGVFRLDATLQSIHINRAMAQFSGLPGGTMAADDFGRASLTDAQRAEWQRLATVALTTGEPQRFQLRWEQSGEGREVHVRVAPYRDADGAIQGVIGVALDMTPLRRAEAALRDSETRFKAFMDHMPAIAWIKDARHRYVFRNKAHQDRYGEPGEDWSGRSDAEFFRPDDAAQYAATDSRVLGTGEPLVYETRNVDRHGAGVDWRIDKFRVTDADGRHYVAGIGVDVSERNHAERLLRESEARFQAFFDHSPALVWMKDDEGRYLYANELHKRFLGVSDDSWRGKTDFDLLPHDFARACREGELRVLDSGKPLETTGSVPAISGPDRHWQLVRFCFVGWGGRRFIGGVAADITEKMRDQERVRRDALTDELTGLYNRRGFKLLVEQELKHAQRERQRCALLVADVDGLKQINDMFGHASGDTALSQVSQVLRRTVRDSDIVARVGGDEFVVFARGAQIGIVRERIANELRAFNVANAGPFLLSVSIGTTEFDADAAEPLDRLLSRADERMYAEKRSRA
ncbi:MAG: PAS domain-containing protein [Gammaproteobacteria bacterium]|nr:PAS domain-containing protein [Gammaproteobacteria bacterium]